MMQRALFAALLVAAGSAHAEVAGETPRLLTLELKLGSYLPLIDRGFATGTGPYATVFQNAAMLLGEMEVEYEVFKKFGVVGLGLGAGYAEKYTKAKIDSGSTGSTGTTSTQTTGIKLVPLKVIASYRFDWLLQHFNVPLVPFVKLGFVAMPWFVTNGDSIEVVETDANGTARGEGVKTGFFGGVGVQLSLNFLDQRLARDFDNSLGVNQTFIFAEFTAQEVNNFGSQKATDFDFSSRHFTFGVALEF